MSTSVLEMAIKIRDAREALRTLAGDKYTEQVAPFKELIAEMQAAGGDESPLSAALCMFMQLDSAGYLTAGVQLHVLAAAADLIDDQAAARRAGQ